MCRTLSLFKEQIQSSAIRCFDMMIKPEYRLGQKHLFDPMYILVWNHPKPTHHNGGYWKGQGYLLILQTTGIVIVSRLIMARLKLFLLASILSLHADLDSAHPWGHPPGLSIWSPSMHLQGFWFTPVSTVPRCTFSEMSHGFTSLILQKCPNKQLLLLLHLKNHIQSKLLEQRPVTGFFNVCKIGVCLKI